MGIVDRMRRSGGFTLLEVLVAAGVLIAVSAGVVQLFAVAASRVRAARAQTSTAMLAAARLEQLRGLAWSYEPLTDPPAPRTDTTTNLSTALPSAAGPGLSASPSDSLRSNRPPFVDYLDPSGRWVGNGPAPPPAAAFIRRWSVAPHPRDPFRMIVLTVLVLPVTAPDNTWTSQAGEETLLVLVRTREGS